MTSRTQQASSRAAGWLWRIRRPPLTLVVNNLRRSSQIEIAALEREADFARGLAVIHRDENAAAGLHGSHFSQNPAPARWRIPVRELAALRASDWQSLEIAQQTDGRVR